MVYRHTPMIRRIALLTLFCLPPCLAQAQERPNTVYFEPLQGREATPLNDAIMAALTQPPFRLEMKPGPQTIVISAPGKIETEKKRVSGTFYSFTIEFFRDRSSLGRSLQSCGLETLSECTDQIVQDLKSVAAR